MMFRAKAWVSIPTATRSPSSPTSEVIEVPETTKWEVAQRVLDQVVRLRKVPQAKSSRTDRDYWTRLLIFRFQIAQPATRHEDFQSEYHSI